MISFRYLRDKDNQPWAMVVGVKDGRGVRIGFSICCEKDKFSKELGRKIALGRSKNGIHGMDSCLKYLEYIIYSPRRHPKLKAVREEMLNLREWLSNKKVDNVQKIS